MENNQIQPEQPYPRSVEGSGEASHPKHHIKIYVWIALVVAALLVAINGYMYFLRLAALQRGAEIAQQNEQAIEALRAQRQSDELGGWQTYTNTEYGFEFKYPNNWEIIDSQGSVIVLVFDSKTPPVPDTDVPINQITIRTYISTPRGDVILFSNQNAFATKWEKGFGEFLWKEIFITEPELYITASAESDDAQKIEDQILSTFKFIDQPDTSTWKTYTNTKYGYQIMYPPSVNVSANEESFAVIVPDSENVMGYGSLLIGPPQATNFIDISQLVLPTCARNIQSVYVGTVKAVQFDGCDMAQPFQIKWISNGKLYNAISYDNLDVALQILSTFRFIR